MQERVVVENCCIDMKKALRSKALPMGYVMHKRMFFIKNRIMPTVNIIFFCPWCSIKFPPDLYREYYDLLENEYKLDHYDIDDGLIPDEFKSDAWWKKRGL